MILNCFWAKYWSIAWIGTDCFSKVPIWLVTPCNKCELPITSWVTWIENTPGLHAIKLMPIFFALFQFMGLCIIFCYSRQNSLLFSRWFYYVFESYIGLREYRSPSTVVPSVELRVLTALLSSQIDEDQVVCWACAGELGWIRSESNARRSDRSKWVVYLFHCLSRAVPPEYGSCYEEGIRWGNRSSADHTGQERPAAVRRSGSEFESNSRNGCAIVLSLYLCYPTADDC
jgi:hypothetical protein